MSYEVASLAASNCSRVYLPSMCSRIFFGRFGAAIDLEDAGGFEFVDGF